MRDFLEIFSVRLQDPQHFLATRFAGLATQLTSASKGHPRSNSWALALLRKTNQNKLGLICAKLRLICHPVIIQMVALARGGFDRGINKLF
jgi:hypothetical protein